MRRASRALCSASVWASFVLASGHARAEESAPPTPSLAPAASGAPAAPTSEPPKATSRDSTAQTESAAQAERAAQAAYEQALATYATGDIKGAFEQMRESYRLSQRPELLYNLARLERELQECHAALEDYRRYLLRVPHGRYREPAEQASLELERECPAADPVPPSAAPAAEPITSDKPDVTAPKRAGPPAATTYWTPPRVLGWSAIAAGVLAGSGSVYFTLEAISARDADQKKINAGQTQHDPVLWNRQHRDATWAQVLGVAGGALIAGGALVLILDPHDKKRAKAVVYVEPGRLEACFSHSF